MSDLTNKVAVVTGGNSGIGYATAEELIKRGAKVIITGRRADAVQEAAAKLENGTVGITASQSNLSDIDNLVAKVKEQHSTIDTLFINAGVAIFVPIEHLQEEDYDNIMDINLKGAVFTLQKFLPLLKEGSSVTFLSSVNAHTGMPNTLAYAASKAGLNSVMRTAAYELSPKKIRVNAVSPGPVETPLFGKIGMPQEAVNEFGQAMGNRVPLKRFGNATEVGKLVSFLSSDDASYITGSEYVIDGGVNLNPLLG